MFKNIQILLVDNSNSMRKMIKSLLKELGYDKIVDADKDSHALELLKSGQNDLIITDWNVPKDREFLVAVKADPKYKSTPIIIISSESNREQIVEAAELGVNGYLVIPINGVMLQEKIEKIFKDKVK